MFAWNLDLGIDLGSCLTTIWERGSGIVLREPSLVAYAIGAKSPKPLAVGEEAKELRDRAVAEARVLQPVAQGVVADHEAAAEMLHLFLLESFGKRRIVLPRVIAALPTAATPVEAAAFLSVLRQAGARRVRLVQRSLAAALGISLAQADQTHRLLVDIGGGAAEVGLLCGQRLLWGKRLPFGGQKLDEALRRFVKARYGLGLSPGSAEEMKLKIGAVTAELAKERISLSGGQVYGGLFRNLDVTLEGVAEFLGRAFSPLFHEVQWLAAECTSEQRADLQATGVTLVGGASQLRGLAQLMAQQTGLPVALAKQPGEAVARGLGIILQDPTRLAADGKSYGARSL